MNITNYPRNNYQKPVQFTGYTSALGKRLDTVIKNDSITAEDNVFISKKITRFVNEKARPSKRLGQGFHEGVYKIDDKYVMKIPIQTSANNPENSENLIFPQRLFSELKTYFGETIAKLGDAKILKNVSSNGKHIQAGVSDKYVCAHTYDEIQQYYQTEYLPIFAKLPQRSFDNIAKDCARLNAKGNYEFDFFNPNNFVLVGKTLRITDEVKKTYQRNQNTISDLLQVFLQKTDIDNLADYSEKAEPLRRELFKKVVLAGMRHNLPLGESPEKGFTWFYTADKLCNLRTSHREILDMLSDIKKEPNTKIRLEKTSNYLDCVFNSMDYGYGWF